MEEIKEYCHYTFAMVTRGGVRGAVPEHYQSRKNVLDEFDSAMGYNPEYWRRFNIELLDAIKTIQIPNTRFFDNDTHRLYDSVFNRLDMIRCGRDSYVLDYEQLFDILADYLWVLASYDQNPDSKKVYLITSQSQICAQSKLFLTAWQINYQDELKTVAEMEYVLSQASIPRSIFLGLQSENYKRYLGNQTTYDLKSEIEAKKSDIRKIQYLFYAFCATNVRYKNLVKRLL